MSRMGLFWVGLSAVLTMGANLLFRAGIDRGQAGMDSSASLVVRYLAWFSQPALITGVVLYGLAGIVWFRIVASEPLSSAYPILVGTTFVLVISGAVILFNESLTLTKIVGSVLILAGILLISRSSP